MACYCDIKKFMCLCKIDFRINGKKNIVTFYIKDNFVNYTILL